MTTSRIAPSAPHASLAASEIARGSRDYFPALDGLRAVAFLMVFATHYLRLPWGWTGVNVFFVLSGFLITGILYDSRAQPYRIANFYLRRSLRIFPLYYGLMLLLVLADPIFRWQWSWHWLLWPAYLGNMARLFPPGAPGAHRALLEFAQLPSRAFPRIQLAFGHFWSLCVEEQFYLVWPWVVFSVRAPNPRRRLIQLCLAGLIATPLLRVLAGHTLAPAVIDNAALLTVTPLPCDALLLGALVALLRRGPRAHAVLPAARMLFAALAAATLLHLATSAAARHSALPHLYSDHPAGTFTWGLTLINLAAACLLVMALKPGSLTFRLLNLRPLRWLGRISYGAYVFHDILHVQTERLAHHALRHYSQNPTLHRIALLTAALAFASTLLLAWASFRWFESPILRLKDRWTRSSVSTDSTGQCTQPATSRLVGHVA